MLARPNSVTLTAILLVTLMANAACIHRGSRRSSLAGETLRQDCSFKGQDLDQIKLTIWSNNKHQIIRTNKNGETKEQILTNEGENSLQVRSGANVVQTSHNRVAANFNDSWRRIADFWTKRHPKTPAAGAIRELFPKNKPDDAEVPLSVNFKIGPVTTGKNTDFVSNTEFSSASFDKPLFIPELGEKDWLTMPAPIGLLGDETRNKNMLSMHSGPQDQQQWKVIRSTWHKTPVHPAQVIWQKSSIARTPPQIQMTCSPPVPSAKPQGLSKINARLSAEDQQILDATNQMTARVVPVQFGILTAMASLATAKSDPPKPDEVMRALVAGFQIFCTEFVTKLSQAKEKNITQKFSTTAENLDHWLSNHPGADTWGVGMMQIAAATGVPEELAPVFLATAAWTGCVETTHPDLQDENAPPQSFTRLWTPGADNLWRDKK